MYNPASSIFAGMTQTALQAALSAAQQAYLDLSMGAKLVTVSYAQGDGEKSVTYSPASVSNLTALIKQLQAQLGLVCRPRAPIVPVFR